MGHLRRARGGAGGYEPMTKDGRGGFSSWRFAGALALVAVAVSLGAAVAYSVAGRHAGAAPAGANAGEVAALPRLRGASGLPLPRFVSLKSPEVRVRRGPSTQYQVAWVYTARGLPVEVVAEFEHWRRIRDADGEEGWVERSLLSGWRTAMVAPWSREGRFVLRRTPASGGAPVAEVRGGVIGRVISCDGRWCKLKIGAYAGWMEQPVLWGVYRGEVYPEKKID